MTGPRFGAIFILGALALSAQPPTEPEPKVTEFTLPNGMHFILLERHGAPVVSFHTFVKVGSAQDPAGQTGLASLLGRQIAKGTESVGSRDWPAEKKALEAVEAAADRLEAEQNKGASADQGHLGSLEIELKRAQDTASALADPAEFARAFMEGGAQGVATRVTPDFTGTSYSLPAHRIELWFLLESQRLKQPVFRDFYQEREAMRTEQHDTVETRTIPILQQALLATAFMAHPYRNPALGWPGDLAHLRVADAKTFFGTYYAPGNIIIAIAGDVDPANARRLAERYFGTIPARPVPVALPTAEPVQLGPKSVVLAGSSQPVYMVGYKRPAETDPDDPVFDVISTMLGNGTSGWMYQTLVEEKKIALKVDVTATLPSGHSPHLFVFTIIPVGGHTPDEIQRSLDELLARLTGKAVDMETLRQAQTVLRGRVTLALHGNELLASMLPVYLANYGDWHRLFASIANINRVASEDVNRVAARYFTPLNRTVAYVTEGQRVLNQPAGPGGQQ